MRTPLVADTETNGSHEEMNIILLQANTNDSHEITNTR